MKTFPLQSMSVEEATMLQFKLVDSITKFFEGDAILSRGDLGVVPGLNRPSSTAAAEKALADFFGCEDAMLARGAGTGALRLALFAATGAGKRLLIHDAPIYPTTKVSIEMLGIETCAANFNDLQATQKAIVQGRPDAVLIQATRQKPDDSYDMKKLIAAIRREDKALPIITDDNYSALKTPYIGVQAGATLSCFSTFKLLGPEGIGLIAGDAKFISRLRAQNYSGGLQVQGHEAIAALRGMVMAPVALAISACVVQEVAKRLNDNEIPGVSGAFIVNAQSKVVIAQFERPIAKEVWQASRKFGAAPHPVGAESKYELVPMFYKVSGTFIEANPKAVDYMLRINPMRAGADTVMRILRESVAHVGESKSGA